MKKVVDGKECTRLLQNATGLLFYCCSISAVIDGASNCNQTTSSSKGHSKTRHLSSERVLEDYLSNQAASFYNEKTQPANIGLNDVEGKYSKSWGSSNNGILKMMKLKFGNHQADSSSGEFRVLFTFVAFKFVIRIRRNFYFDFLDDPIGWRI